MRATRCARLFGLCFVVVLTLGCAARHRPTFLPAGDVSIVWPSPPEAARVAWEGEYRAARGGFVRPHGVGWSSTEEICVADPTGGVVWRYRIDGRARALGTREVDLPMDCDFLPDGGMVVADSAGARVVLLDEKGKRRWASADGAFERPTAVAVDDARRRIVVADTKAHQIVLIDYQGEVLGRMGGRGSEPGRFNFPTALDVTEDGSICVVDTLNFRIQVLSAEGEALTVFGVAGDGPGSFMRPRGVTMDSTGRIFVADALFDNVQIFDREGALLMAVGGTGRGPGEFWMPAGMAVTGDGRFLVADAFNQRVQVFRMLGEAEEDAP